MANDVTMEVPSKVDDLNYATLYRNSEEMPTIARYGSPFVSSSKNEPRKKAYLLSLLENLRVVNSKVLSVVVLEGMVQAIKTVY